MILVKKSASQVVSGLRIRAYLVLTRLMPKLFPLPIPRFLPVQYIDRFEKQGDGKYCFYFSKSEEIFFEYPHSRVQARHYRNSIDLEKCDKLSENEIKNRLEKSKNIKSEASTSKTKTSGILEPAKEELTKIRNEKFKDQPLPTAEQARKLIESVEDGEDADAVVTEFYLEKNK